MKSNKNSRDAIRNKYSEMGVDNYYRRNKHTYENPHLQQVYKCLGRVINKIDVGKTLDLACGNGACTEYLLSKGYEDCKGCDPYFSGIYAGKFKTNCYSQSFEDIATHSLPEQFDTIICSYALHLCPPSYFEQLLYNLSLLTKRLVVISPSKFPLITETYFNLVDKAILDRTHCRIYEVK